VSILLISYSSAQRGEFLPIIGLDSSLNGLFVRHDDSNDEVVESRDE
jgi:hypothetical protein